MISEITRMNEECLICKAPLEYLSADEKMECVLCHKKQYSKTRCVKGHFVCDVTKQRMTDNINIKSASQLRGSFHVKQND